MFGVVIASAIIVSAEQVHGKTIHDWEQVHVSTEDKLIDKYEKKIDTFAGVHYHDYHVYHTIKTVVFRCALHGDYKTKTIIHNTRHEEQTH